MIRKLVLGLAATAVVASAALAPTAASAGGFIWPNYHPHPHFFGPPPLIVTAPAPLIVSGPTVPPSCFEKRLVQTRKGLRWRFVNVCAF